LLKPSGGQKPSTDVAYSERGDASSALLPCVSKPRSRHLAPDSRLRMSGLRWVGCIDGPHGRPGERFRRDGGGGRGRGRRGGRRGPRVRRREPRGRWRVEDGGRRFSAVQNERSSPSRSGHGSPRTRQLPGFRVRGSVSRRMRLDRRRVHTGEETSTPKAWRRGSLLSSHCRSPALPGRRPALAGGRRRREPRV